MIDIIKNKAQFILMQYTSPRQLAMQVLMSTKRYRVAKILFFLFCRSLSALFFFLIPGCLGTGSIREVGYIPGIYEGTGQGYRGPIHVEVELSSTGIEDITITGHSEGAYPGGAAMEELLEAVLETGATELDAVSGATFSSAGFLEAVEDALGKAATP
jgi:fumarate reductase flavoprotein subunit